MNRKTHHDLICESLAVESETRQAETLRAYRVRQSTENLDKAVGRVVGDRELTKGEALIARAKRPYEEFRADDRL